ncbi:MAG: terminase small subunit [Steroidobacteraceae bacterium]
MPSNAASKARKAGTKAPSPGSKLAKGADGLNDKQRAFCAEYIVDLNGTAAAKRAGYSEKTARAIAQELLVRPQVVAKVQALMDERANRTQVTADRVITEVARLAFADLRKLFDPLNGELLPPAQWPDELAAAVASIEVEELMGGTGPERVQIGWTKKVKLWDKPKSLEMLGRHLKLWVERHEHTGPNGGPIATRNDGVDLSKLTDAELEQLEAIVTAAEQRSAGR